MILLAALACTGPTEPVVERTPPEGDAALVFDHPPRNLLVISIDTTRKDHIDRWAPDGLERTPFLSALMASGVVLDDHLQCSNWTFASTSCTHRGQLMEETGFYPKLSNATRAPLPEHQGTLATRLGRMDFHSGLVSSNDWLSDNWNNVEGIDEFHRRLTGNTGALLDDGIGLLREWRDRGDERRWFLQVHLVEPHPPYTPPDAYDPTEDVAGWDLDSQAGQYDVTRQWPQMTEAEQQQLVEVLDARYSGELQYMDAQLAQRWQVLQDEGFLDDTLVVFWNDHGEQFFEHGQQAHAYGLNAEEGDAFMAFVGAGLQPMAWTAPTHAVDFVPTVLQALGADPEQEAGLMGYVLGTSPAGRPRYAATDARLGPQVSVVDGDWKMVFDMDDGTVGMWNRRDDPKELRDRFEAHDEKAQELWELLRPRARLLEPLVPEVVVRWPKGLDSR
ncbi:MAG: sulfatase-like hydrolase/transferase [Myxococcales bacterium]|nr:sulfatase-like hydrolase/transferase [Myxococcales bacterium]MCA9567338.1 sulfatase-like hydrolase/transferase [Myxococcales bacterium]